MGKSFKLKHDRQELPLVIILTALEVEFMAVVSHLDDIFTDRNPNGTIYECGFFVVPSGQSWAVAVVECGMGNQRASAEVVRAVNYFGDAEVILFVGVAGGLKEPMIKLSKETVKGMKSEGIPNSVINKLKGLPNKKPASERHFMDTLRSVIGAEPSSKYGSLIQKHVLKWEVGLGDIVACTKAYNYHPGKADEKFLPWPDLASSAYGLEQQAKAIRRKNLWISRIKNPTFNSETIPKVHVAPLATGEHLLSSRDSQTFISIRQTYNDAIAVEMEGYGTLLEATNSKIDAIVIRGISDQIEYKSKSDSEGWQEIASAHASAFAFEMLSAYVVESPVPQITAPKVISPVASKPTPTVEWTLSLDGDPDMSDEQVEAVEQRLQDLSDEQNLRVTKTEHGSINLHLKSSEKSFEKINALYRKGILSDLEGFNIKNIYSKEQYNRINEIRISFERASKSLLNWPMTLDGKKWLTRKELMQIDNVLRKHDSSTTLVLGQPGGGKSALLAKLGSQSLEQDIAVLAIKADKLDLNVNSLIDLGTFLGLPFDPVTSIRVLAQGQTVLVILDQLDALADLVDLRSQRLNVLLDLMSELSEIENIHLVCSCREFEYNHDIRLNSIQATIMRLSLPDWAEVSEALTKRNIAGETWPERFRNILLVPQHLKVFLELCKGSNEAKIFKSYQGMLEHLWRQKITNREGLPGRSELITEMAVLMSEEEKLWLPLAQFEDSPQNLEVIDFLEAEGILIRSDDDLSISFRHQTLFDYARARAFSKGRDSLSKFVINRQDALFVRPKLWSSLGYLRAVDKRNFKKEFEKLWSFKDLRLHIRYLLIEFLGQVENPQGEEIKWLIEGLEKPEFKPKVLASVEDNKAWFDVLSMTHLPVLMSNENKEAYTVVGIIGKAWSFAREKNLKLIKKYWLNDRSKDPLLWQSMQQIDFWDAETIEIACTILKRTEVNDHSVMYMATVISASAPILAPKIVATALYKKLEYQIEKSKKEPTPTPPPPNADEYEILEYQFLKSSKKPFEQILDERTHWYELPAIAEAAPVAFLDSLLPWLLKILKKIADKLDKNVMSYRGDSAMSTIMDRQEFSSHYPIVSAIELAITKFAETSPSTYVKFLKKWGSSDFSTVQRLLARGLIQIPEPYTNAIYTFLLEDPRRLALGSYQDVHFDTKALITAIVPNLSKENLKRLEEYILAWNFYDEKTIKDKQTKRESIKFNRQHRLKLLKAFPVDSRSSKIQNIINEEERAFPHHTDWDVKVEQIQTIVSPMSLKQMESAHNKHIIQLFNELEDKTEWDHPRDFMKGGSIQASRIFAELAKKHPRRAVSIIEHLEPKRQERPVAFAIEALADSSYPTKSLLKLVSKLDTKGFKSGEFRTRVAVALEKKAIELKGLPVDICTLLEKWLSEPKGNSVAIKKKQEKHHHTRQKPQDERDKIIESVLWGHGGIEVLPQGNYTILNTLTNAYMLKSPPQTEKWLKVLNEHLERPERGDVWYAFWRQLRFLTNCNKADAIAFLKKLYEKFPGVRDRKGGAILLAQIQAWIPEDIMKDIIFKMRDGNWENGPQASTEIMLLRHVTFPEEQWINDGIEEILAPKIKVSKKISMMRLGLAYTAVNLWDDPKYRSLVNNVLIRLIPVADDAISYAIIDVFRIADTLYADRETSSLLETLLLYPKLLRNARHGFLIDRLQDLLPANPNLVLKVSDTLVEEMKSELSTMGTSISASAPELVNIALTLQRYEGKLREKGLTLFEKLLELEVYGARDALVELDGRPVNVKLRSRRRRQRRRKPKP